MLELLLLTGRLREAELLAEGLTPDLTAVAVRASELLPGDRVALRGLRAAALNGAKGSLGTFDAASGRWKVAVDGDGVKAIKPENLEALSASAAGKLKAAQARFTSHVRAVNSDREDQLCRETFSKYGENFDPKQFSEIFQRAFFGDYGYFESHVAKVREGVCDFDLDSLEGPFKISLLVMCVRGFFCVKLGSEDSSKTFTPKFKDRVGRHGDIITLLLNEKAHPNIRDTLGYTPIHHATNHIFDEDICSRLLDAKADPDLGRTQFGGTALH